jgi:Raf kinase inhibitor-like YbhB/YbcL family protein
MKITSSAFENGASIPARYTCEGEDVSPPLSWQGVPEEAVALALVVDDPDAGSGTFTHWVVYNLPIIPQGLDEGVSLDVSLSEGLREGFNDFGRQGYGGPCPPKGDGIHRYIFRLFALKQVLEFSGRVTRGQLMDAIEKIVIEEAILLGYYERK